MDPRETARTLSDYGRAIVEAWLDDRRYATELAKAAQLSPSFITGLQAQEYGLGTKAIVGFASALGLSLGEFERRAQDWHRAGRPALGPEALPPREKRR